MASCTPHDDLAIIGRIKAIVEGNPEIFAAAGGALDDDEAGYSDKAMRQREARRKRYWHAVQTNFEAAARKYDKLLASYNRRIEQWEEARRDGKKKRKPKLHKMLRGSRPQFRNKVFSTRAAWRRIYGPNSQGDAPWPKPLPKWQRFQQAWTETRKQLTDWPMDQRELADREAMAARVLLLTWLATDPDAHAIRPYFTDFQNWQWVGDLNVLDHPDLNATGHAAPDKPAMYRPDDVPEPPTDRLVTRYCMRQQCLENEWEQWRPLVQQAIDILSPADEHQTGGGSNTGFLQRSSDGDAEQIRGRYSPHPAVDPENGHHEPEQRIGQDGEAVKKATADADVNGYVRFPADPTAYTPVAKILADHCDDLPVTLTEKRLGEIVEDFPKNRVRWTRPIAKTGEPKRNRRNIHLNDWLKYVERFTQQDADPSQDVLEQRKDEIRRRK